MNIKYSIIKKTLVFVAIMLFFGASIVSAINIKTELINVIENVENLSPDIETFYPTEDGYIKHDAPNANMNYDYFRVRNEYGGYGSPGWEMDGLIRFDISSLPAKANIISAKLYIYYYDWDSTNPVNRPVRLYRATSDWSEDTVTWNTQPSYAPQSSSSATMPNHFDWVMWDVTNDIKDFIKGEVTNYGWKVTDDNYWGDFYIPEPLFYTKESINHIPYLEVEFTKSRSKDIINPLFLQFLERFFNLFPMLQNLLNLPINQ